MFLIVLCASCVDLTPCISPLPHDAALLEKTSSSQLTEDTEVPGVRKLFGAVMYFKIYHLQIRYFE